MSEFLGIWVVHGQVSGCTCLNLGGFVISVSWCTGLKLGGFMISVSGCSCLNLGGFVICFLVYLSDFGWLRDLSF